MSAWEGDDALRARSDMRQPTRRRRCSRAAVASLVGVLAAVVAGLLAVPVSSGAEAAAPPVRVWETNAAGTVLLAPQPGASFAAGTGPTTPTGQKCIIFICVGGTTPDVIAVQDTQRYQQMAGFGAAMTDSSAYVLLHDLSATQRAAVMTQLFDPVQGAGLDYLRIPIGANDFSTANYTEDDVPSGQTDPTLAHFSIAHDLVNLVPALKQALAINPNIQLLASPWSAPAWMKTTGTLDGGSLIPADYGAYALYLVKFIQAYAEQGIKIAALTLQNEPDDPETSYPGMTVTAAQEATLIPLVGKDLAAAGLSTQILGFDSDWSDISFATNLLATPGVAQYVTGTAVHCYAGDPSAQLTLQADDPTKGIYETECSGFDSYPSFGVNLDNGTGTLVINAVRDWSKTVLLWNMALDQDFGPTNHGCLDCIPNVTIDSSTGQATYDPEYYVLAQVSKFVQPGAYRVESTDLGSRSVQTVAFQNPNGSDVLLALNSASSTQSMTVQWDGEYFTYAIPAGAVQTFEWGGSAPPASTATSGSPSVTRTEFAKPTERDGIADLGVTLPTGEWVHRLHFVWEYGASFGRAVPVGTIERFIALYPASSAKPISFRISRISTPHGRIWIAPGRREGALVLHLNVKHVALTRAFATYLEAHHRRTVTATLAVTSNTGATYRETVTVTI